MNQLLKIFISAFLLLLFIANAQALQINTEADVLNLERGQSIGTLVRITNDSFDVRNYTLKASTEDFDLELIPAVKEFRLNPQETISFSITIVATEETNTGTHFVDIEIGGDGQAERTIEVEVREEAGIELIPEQDKVEFCKEPYTKYIDVEVRNESGISRTVQLKGESEILLPVFEPSELTVAANSSRDVRMKIHINHSTQLDEFDVGMFAFYGNTVVERNVVVEINECEDGETPPFRLEIIDGHLSIDKGEEKKARFRLVSLIDDDQDVRISAVSDLKVEEFDQLMHLGGNETEEGKILVFADENDEADVHDVIVYAWNDLGEDSENIEVDVEPMHKLNAVLLNNDILNRICSAVDFEVFELEISNDGDLRERVNISVDNPYDSIGIVITENNFQLDAGEKKIVQIAVQPAFDTELGDKTVNLRVDSSTDSEFEFEEELNFTVVAAPENVRQNVLQIVSYPRSIEAHPGEQKTMKIGIRNPTNESVGPLTVRIRGTSSEFSFTGGTIMSIPAGEAREVEGNINVASHATSKRYDLTLEVVGDNYHSFVPFSLEVTPAAAETEKEQDFAFGGTTLLAGLFNGGIIGGITILIIALGIFIILIMFILSSGNKKAPHWVSRRVRGQQNGL